MSLGRVACSEVSKRVCRVLLRRRLCTREVGSVPLAASSLLGENFRLYENFISPGEEESLMKEIDGIFRRRRYEFDHWDGAIRGYKETERTSWDSPENDAVLRRVRDVAFDPSSAPLRDVHVLDLAADGWIRPHVDSVRFCGDTIAGLSLLSSCVMRLVSERDSGLSVDILLPQRSLYVMRGAARYEFTHEILPGEHSCIGAERVPRARRVALICRNEPAPCS